MNRASGIKMQSKGSFVGNLRPSGAKFGLDTPFGRVFSSFSPLFLLFSPSFSSSFSPSGGCRHTEKKPFFLKDPSRNASQKLPGRESVEEHKMGAPPSRPPSLPTTVTRSALSLCQGAPLCPAQLPFHPLDPIFLLGPATRLYLGKGARTQHTGRPMWESRPLVVGPRPCLDVP